MNHVFLMRTAGTLGALLAAGLPSHAVAQISYTWANRPAAAEYQPDPLYSHNSAGGTITISRHGTGAYTIRFAGLGEKGRGGGHVQVTGYGDGSDMCKVARWGYRRPDFVVEVRCFGADGAAADGRYTVLAGWPAEQPPLPAGAGAGPGEPVKRLVLEDGTIEFRYPDGTVRRLTRHCRVVIPPGAAPDSTCVVFAEVPYNLPPLSDPGPRGLRAWVEDRSDQLMR
ncbi:MAG: hypothetical protein L0191_11845, partial [Acidobacteria bacterium]|nr:hypothetical protein [Acidobacteriota bacterium]